MSQIDIGATREVPPGTAKAFAAAGKEIVIANLGGTFYAIARKCPHLGGDLSKGALSGTTITCPRHHAQFDITTGACLAGPKIGPLKLSTKAVSTYAVKVEGDRILVDV